MKKYDSYKDSGVEWVGEIPSKWEWLKIKNLFSFSKGTGISKSDIEEDGTSNCILYGELFTRFKDFNVIPNEFSKTNLEERIVSEGDELLIPGSTTTTSVDLCNCKTLNHKGIQLGGDIIILKPRRNDIYNEFYSYYISTVTKPDFETGGRGVTIHHIYPKQIREIHIPYIPLSEQQQIVSFLDTKTSLIDSLIEKTQRKIELLKEKRTSLINEVVTKGLNPNVEMKDSGVEWLGEIPYHWEMSRIKFYLNEIIDTEHKTVPFQEDGTYYVVRTSNIRGGTLNLEGCKMTDCSGFKDWTVRGIPEPGDVLLTREAPVGECCVIPEEISFCMGQRVVWLQLQKEKINPHFLVHVIYSLASKIFIENLSIGSTVSHLNMSEIGNIPILHCSVEEQEQIVEYLDEQTSIIDSTITKEEKRIELLKEYRQSLISELVTGKVKVTRDE